MDRRLLLLSVITLLIIVAALALFVIPAPVRDTGVPPGSAPTGTSTPVATYDNLIRVTSPTPGSGISSPVIITGQARGSWYSEGQFPVEVLDANGQIVGQSPATAQGDWQTNDYVPFSVTIILTAQPAPGSAGGIVLKNGNPSGSTPAAASLSVPVVFL